jgi:hypothetical protein
MTAFAPSRPRTAISPLVGHSKISHPSMSNIQRWQNNAPACPEDAGSSDIVRMIERRRKKAIEHLDNYLSRRQYISSYHQGYAVVSHSRSEAGDLECTYKTDSSKKPPH